MTITAYQLDQWEKQIAHLEGLIRRLTTERDTTRAQIATLTEALRWYADADKFALNSSEHPQDRARAALKAAGVEE